MRCWRRISAAIWNESEARMAESLPEKSTTKAQGAKECTERPSRPWWFSDRP